ncbi:protein O-mannosyl-transferase family [Armatimonas rosea]|uniref:DUF2723 domain-containing protein n=1 Tax=Armatimonas rosea TaxID=685828 RepID=A0A7W9SUJ4_ARMRO|nr:DUF2723 domain-containing protein [Armatimonas rosea]MBB6052229.1 hypothetical protein [Armatimonas rosea]
MRVLLDRFGLLVAFLISILLLWWGAAPWLTYHDSGEFALAAESGGIPHAPGAPTYCFLAWGFVALGQRLFPLWEAAYLTNLFSGLWGALTITTTIALARLGSRQLFGDRRGDHLPLLLVPAQLLGSSTFVEQSCITEQYTLQTALWMGVLLVLTKIALQGKHRLGLVLGGLIGLAIGNHPSQIILIPLLGLAVYLVPRTRRVKSAGEGILGLLLGLLIFLYIPLRSRVDPTIDFGNADTFERFLRVVLREQWQQRPLSAAPSGFVQEWLQSYDFWGQLGPLGFLLAVLGGVVLWQRYRPLLGLLLGLGGIYTGGLLWAHLHQAGIDLMYLRDYGVKDWHLPLYTFAVLLACFGAEGCARRFAEKGRLVVTLLSVGLVVWGALQAVTSHSLRHFTAPQQFLTDTLAPLPKDALIIASSDNLTLMLGYAAYTKTGPSALSPAHSRFRVLSNPSLVTMERVLSEGGEGAWNTQAQSDYLVRLTTEAPPFHAPIFTPGQPLPRIFIEYYAGYPRASQYLRPAGWLFEVSEAPVSDEEIRLAEKNLQLEHPELLKEATGKEHRLEREMRGLVHQSRGAFFYERRLWPEAAEALRLSCTYLSRSGRTWYCLGTSYENLGRLPEARSAYLEAIEVEPTLEGPRLALGVLLAQSGQLEAAKELFAQELALSPKNEAARANLQLVTRQLGSR